MEDFSDFICDLAREDESGVHQRLSTQSGRGPNRPFVMSPPQSPLLISEHPRCVRCGNLACSLELQTVDEEPSAETGQSRPWKQRYRLGRIPDEPLEPSTNVTALEKALRNYAMRRQGLVVQPYVGARFDSLEEAFEFYNLYS